MLDVNEDRLTIFLLRHGRHAPPLDGCDVIKESSRRNKEAKRTSVAWVHYDRKGLEMEKMEARVWDSGSTDYRPRAK